MKRQNKRGNNARPGRGQQAAGSATSDLTLLRLRGRLTIPGCSQERAKEGFGECDLAWHR